jgi:hypothetical protein
VSVTASVGEALERALADASFTVVAGSSFVIGETLALLERIDRADRPAPREACGMLRPESR